VEEENIILQRKAVKKVIIARAQEIVLLEIELE